MIAASVLGPITRCQICLQPALEPILEFGHHPPVHSHVTPETLHQPEITFPLTLCRCPNCGLCQLDYAVDPKVLFPDEYPYHTGMTEMLVKSCRELAAALLIRGGLTSRDLAIDIGSNDGTLLQGFREHGIRVLGIEPTGVARTANARGIPSLQAFFNEDTAKNILKSHGKAKVITATNVFAHVNNLYELLRGVELLLDDKGLFVTDSQYLLDIVQKLELDTIYHEHLRFYSLKPLLEMFNRTGISLIDAERIAAAGGSIRVYAMKGRHEPSIRVRELISAEEHAGLYDVRTFHAFAARAREAKRILLARLLECRSRGGRVVGVGAPARSNTLLNFIGIDRDLIDYAVERRGSPKIGLRTPGAHIPIVDEERLFTEQPAFALILSWHLGDELVKKLRERGYRGACIIPLPEPRFC